METPLNFDAALEPCEVEISVDGGPFVIVTTDVLDTIEDVLAKYDAAAAREGGT